MTRINSSERGEQLTEDEEVDGMQREVHVACDFVALDGAADAAALALLQLLAKLVQAATYYVRPHDTRHVPCVTRHLPSNESS